MVINVVYKNKRGISITDKHTLRIKGLPSGFTLINGYGCARKCIVELSKKEVLNAEISYEMPDFLFDPKIDVTGFTIGFIDSNYKKIYKSIEIQGNKINNKTYLEIEKIKNISFLIISDIHIQAEDLDLLICKISPIKVLIIE
ncbi:GldM family protein [Flavobacterium sp.]|uniref:GldM family protein n=1 Tax=Flavobacterium sp. TaxID=239 RepID=UPI0038FCBDE1